MALNSVYIQPTTRRLLATVARLKFATREQLLYWSDVTSLSTITKQTLKLEAEGFLQRISYLRPSPYCLTQMGAKSMGESYLKSMFSASKIIQLCHKNEAEISLQKLQPNAFIQSRIYSYKHGFNPSHAEYLAVTKQNVNLILVDDYQMDSSRILHSWTRPHEANRRYFKYDDSHKKMHYEDVCHKLFVFCTDPYGVEKHSAFCKEIDLPVHVQHIKAIWQVN